MCIRDRSYKDLLEFHPDINKVHFLNLKTAKKKKSIPILIKELKKIRKLTPYDIVVDMQGLIKSAVVSRIIPSKVTIGFDRNSLREGLASTLYNKKFKYSYSKNIIERNFELIKFALEMPFQKEDIQYKLPFLYDHKQDEISILSNTKKNVILIPGASHITKRYSPENFSKLTKLLDVNYLVIWGDDEEKIIVPPTGIYVQPWCQEPPEGSQVLDRKTREIIGSFAEMKQDLGVIIGEEKVFDTWMDSSNSNLFVSGYLNHPDVFKDAFPTSLRPQGKEIVRTWLYYTLLLNGVC